MCFKNAFAPIALIEMIGLLYPCIAQQVPVMKEPSWLAFGSIQGYIDTCGCDPNKDVGGIDRLATLIERERGNGTPFKLYDLGNNYDPKQDEYLKNKYITRSLRSLGISASLLNNAELNIHPELLKGRRFVISNAVVPDKYPIDVQTFISDKETVVFGYLWIENPQKKLELQPWSLKLAGKWKEIIGKHSSKERVLLFSGPLETLKSIKNLNLFETIIVSNPSKHRQPDFRERDHPISLQIVIESDLMWAVPYAGMGILRGGAMQKSVALSPQELIQPRKASQSSLFSNGNSQPEIKFFDGNNDQIRLDESVIGAIDSGNQVTWLDTSYDGPSPIKAILAEYEAKLANQFENERLRLLKSRENGGFVGALACKACHPQAYAAWQNSRHYKAYETLKEKGKDKNPNCVGCHVVGYREPGGFIAIADTPKLAGVQCENCHGPRKDHVSNPIKHKGVKVSKESCESCHHPPHSGSFSYDKYWKKIKHGLTQ